MKSNLRIRLLASIAGICLAASSLRAGSPRLSGSVTLPSETRWGSLLLASGTYQFTLDHEGVDGRFTIKQGKKGIGVILVRSVSLSRSSTNSSMLIAGNRVQSLYLAPLGATYIYPIRSVEKEMVATKSNVQSVALSISKRN
jgi:hypothetical protein